MLSSLYRPRQFFAERARVSLGEATGIVLLAGLAQTFYLLFLLPELLPRFSSAKTLYVSAGLLIGAGGQILTTGFYWFFYSGLFHSISLIFGGEGRFRRTVIYTGYGFGPLFLAGILNGFLSLLASRAVDPPSEIEAVDPYLTDVFAQDVFVWSKVVVLLVFLWQTWIWVGAMKHARTLSLKHATLTVCVPVGARIVWFVYRSNLL